MVATVWCDKKPIYFLSSIHMPVKPCSVQRGDDKGNSLEIPATPCVVEYNRHMGGVDKNDQNASIDKSRKQYKWYAKLIHKGIMWSLYNGFIIEGHFVDHREPGKRRRDFYSFCLDAAHQLVGDFTNRQRIHRMSANRSSHKRLTDSDHFPTVTDSYDLRCVVCDEKYRRKLTTKRSKTTITCTSQHCGVPLCVKRGSNCWSEWHSKLEYWH